MASSGPPKADILRFTGCAQFRQRILFATLAHKKLRIDGIRDKDEAPGLRDFEANFLRLVEKLTNGCRTEINETGTSLKYAPGWVVGGSVEHDCGTGRSIGWFLEGILPLVPFGKKPTNVVFSGITNDDADLSLDLIKTIHLPTMTHFGISEGLKLDILARGCPPAGGGRVAFSCPVVRELTPISLTDEGFIKRIRGLTYSCKVSPHMSNRIVDAARGVLNPLLSDVYLYTDHKKGPEAGSSPGYGVSLVAASTSGCIYGAQRCTGMARGLVDPSLGGSSGNGGGPPLAPEDLGKAAAEALLEQIGHGGCIDDNVQPLVFTLMLMCPEDVSRVRVGRVGLAGTATLRLIRDVWGVTFMLKAEEQRDAPKAKRRKVAGGEAADGGGEGVGAEGDVLDAGVRLGKAAGKKRRGEIDAPVRAALTAEAGGGYSSKSTILVSCLGLGYKNFAKKVLQPYGVPKLNPKTAALTRGTLPKDVFALQTLVMDTVGEMQILQEQLTVSVNYLGRLKNALEAEKGLRVRLIKQYAARPATCDCNSTCGMLRWVDSMEGMFDRARADILALTNQASWDGVTARAAAAIAKGETLGEEGKFPLNKTQHPAIRVADLFDVRVQWFNKTDPSTGKVVGSGAAGGWGELAYRFVPSERQGADKVNHNPATAGDGKDVASFCSAAWVGLENGGGVFAWGAGKALGACLTQVEGTASTTGGGDRPSSSEVLPAQGGGEEAASTLRVSTVSVTSGAGDADERREFVPPPSLRHGYADPGPSAAQAALLRLLLPSPGGGNPLRSAWIAHGLDWHDLVRPSVTVRDNKAGVAAYVRADRELAKAGLLRLVGSWTPGASAATRPWEGAEVAAGHAAVDCQVALTYALVGNATSLSAIAAALSNPVAANGASAWLGVDPVDLTGQWVSSRERGALEKYAACDAVQDPCMVHATARACVEDELCGWCPLVREPSLEALGRPVTDPSDPAVPSAGLCLGRWEAYRPEADGGRRAHSCAAPLWVTRDSVPALRPARGRGGGVPYGRLTFPPRANLEVVHVEAEDNNCSVVITRKAPVLLGISGDSKMAFHFYTETVPGWFGVLRGQNRASRVALGASGGLGALSTHIYVPASSVDEFLPMLYPFTDACPRRTNALPAIPNGEYLCYAMAGKGRAARERAEGGGEESESEHGRPRAAALWGRPAPPLALWDPVKRVATRWPRRTGGGRAVDWEDVLGDPHVAVMRGRRLGLTGLTEVARAVLGDTAGADLNDGNATVHERTALQREAADFLAGLTAHGQESFASFTTHVLALWWVHPWPPTPHAAVADRLVMPVGRGAPPVFRPLVTVLSRRNKRFILNEEEVVRLALALGARVRVVALEELSIAAQIRVLKQTAVLVGMHGSGLINTMYMTPGTALIQVVPPLLSGAAAFFQGPANANGVKYLEHYVELAPPPASKGPVVRSTNASAFHFHFLDSTYPPYPEVNGGERGVLEQGSDCCGHPMYFSFWVNCDVRVELEGFGRVLHAGLAHYRESVKGRWGGGDTTHT